MQKFEECPELEELAALVEGRLDSVARERLLLHLEGCEICFETFTETSRFLLDRTGDSAGELAPEQVRVPDSRTAPQPLRAPVARAGPHPAIWIGLAAAAVLLLVLFSAGGLQRWFGSSASRLPATDLASLLQSRGPGLIDELWATSNPAGFTSSSSARGVAFQSGVLMLDLAIAQAGGATTARDALASRLGNLHPGVGWADPARLATAAGILAAESELAGGDDFYYEFGKWAEAGRLAAKNGDAAFFEEDFFGDFLTLVRKRDWPEPVRLRLQEMESLLAAREEGHLVSVEQALADLIALNL